MISIIIPTYCEVQNIPVIIPKIFEVLQNENIQSELIIVDDNSPDGTADAAQTMANQYPVRVAVREKEKGLATAVIKGFDLANGDICVVMDADLSHPVEKLPDLIRPLMEQNLDAVIGSRYVNGSGIEGCSLFRKMISRVGGLLAKGLTEMSDPTSGFIAFKKSLLNNVKLNPIGWKIILELMVKADPKFKEIPIRFAKRKLGKNKFSIKVQIDFLRHLWRLYFYKFSKSYKLDKTFQTVK